MQCRDTDSDRTADVDMKRLFFSVLDSALMEIDSRFGERSQSYVRALTGLLSESNVFLDFSTLKPLIDLVNINETQHNSSVR